MVPASTVDTSNAPHVVRAHGQSMWRYVEMRPVDLDRITTMVEGWATAIAHRHEHNAFRTTIMWSGSALVSG
jgi:hypothetical protein